MKTYELMRNNKAIKVYKVVESYKLVKKLGPYKDS